MNRPFRLRSVMFLWSLLVVTCLMTSTVRPEESQSETEYEVSEANEESDAETDTVNEVSYDTAAEDNNNADDGDYNEETQSVGDNDDTEEEQSERSADDEEQASKEYSQHHQPQPHYYEPAPPAHYEHSKPKEKKKKVFVPVFVPEKEKKKMKIISVDKGFYIQGGTQLFGKFKSLKHCMKACAVTPACLSGDFNPWLHKCYQHTNFTACNTFRAHPQYVHFSKVPCTVVDAPTGRVTLGASMANGIEQKGIDNLQQCIKKCAIAGGGVQATATVPDSFVRQGCFAIDYDFSTHKCFFFGNNVVVTFSTSIAAGVTFTNPFLIYLHCPLTATKVPSSLGTRANPNVVHITFCPLPQGFVTAG